MTSLFSFSMDSIMHVVLAVFVAVTAVTLILAARNRLLVKLGLRNLPKRRAQSILIIFGLMLATTIMASAFATGDTISYSIRSLAVKQLGTVDETVTAGKADRAQTAAPGYMPAAMAGRVLRSLSSRHVDGVTGAIAEAAALQDLTSRQTKAQSAILGLPAGYPAAFGLLTTTSGQAASVAGLGMSQLYINQTASTKLNAHVGDRIRVFVDSHPAYGTVKAVLRDDGLASGGLVSPSLASTPQVIMPLDRVQRITGRPGQISTVLISNRGDALGGAALTGTVKHELRSSGTVAGYTTNTVKDDYLQAANQAGSEFTSGFIAFGLFSMAAGVMLIFLIFVMLAAERRAEMGMARAVGTKRRQLVQQFLFEGYVYDIGAAVVGVALGIGVGLGMVSIMAALLSPATDFTLSLHVEPRSMVVAFCLGAIITFITVAASAWRISRLNIVAAIRDLPDELGVDDSIRAAFARPVADLARAWRRLRRARPLGALAAVLAAPWHLLTAFRVFISRGPLLVLAGYVLFTLGSASKQAFPYTLGISLSLIGVTMLIRWILGGLGVRTELRNRIGFSLAGLSLVGYWLLPFDFFRSDLSVGIEMFFLSGLMLILGGVWTVMYNVDLILAVLMRVLGGGRRLAPVLRTAVTYPTQHRLRTGLTVFMLSLVVFALMVQAVLISSFGGQTLDIKRDAGGYQISATSAAPIPNLGTQLASTPSLRHRITSAGASSRLDASLRQPGVGGKGWLDYPVLAADSAFLAGTQFPLHARAGGYTSDAQVWETLRSHPGYAVINDALVRGSQNAGSYTVNGLTYSTTRFKPFRLEMRDKRTGRILPLTVIGVVNPSFASDAFFGTYISASTLTAAHDAPARMNTYYFRVAPGQSVHNASLALGAAFIRYGLDTAEVQAQYDQNRSLQIGFNSVLEGFMALGLIVGIAALGVIATRSVVERRQQIGMLRAIGFQRRMVRLSFLLESSFVCVLGTLIGVILGLLLGYQVVAYFAKSDPGLTFSVPWLVIGGILVLTYLASLLTTYFPAWQASRVYPAEALRYE